MSKILVAYFSATGTTKRVALQVAKAIGADTFEIVPTEPYSAADLDWNDRNSRSSVETREVKTSRPAIKDKVGNMETYDTVFLGFPLWWYREPRIIDTFLEAYCFSGKRVVPFVTSGSSSFGKTGTFLAALAKGAKVEEGKRFAEDVSEKEVTDWAKTQA